MPSRADNLKPTSSSLLRRVRDWNDQQSWKQFFDTYWRLIYAVAIKAGLTDAEAQDVVQDTMMTVAKKIKEFRYDRAAGSFRGWLMKTTRFCQPHYGRTRTVLSAKREAPGRQQKASLARRFLLEPKAGD